MRMQRPKPLKSLLAISKINQKADRSPLYRIKQHSLNLIKINQLIFNQLNPPLRHIFHVANYRNGLLILEISSANWLLPMRAQQIELATYLRRHLLSDLIAIEIKIAPRLATNNYKPLLENNDKSANREKSRKIGLTTALALHQLAQKSRSKTLADALKRLAAHVSMDKEDN